MTWSIIDVSTKNTCLGTINTNLGTSAKISWQNSGSSELATTSLYTGGSAFSAPQSGSMNILSAAGSATTPVQLLSSTFSGSGCSAAKFQTSGSSTIFQGSVASPSGGDINADAIPAAGQQLRLDSLSLGFV